MDKKQPEPILHQQQSSPPWAAELPIQLADLDDFIRRHRIRGARVVVTDQGLALAYECLERKETIYDCRIRKSHSTC